MQIPLPDLAPFYQQWQITELAAFGSILRDDFHDTSVTYSSPLPPKPNGASLPTLKCNKSCKPCSTAKLISSVNGPLSAAKTGSVVNPKLDNQGEVMGC